MSKQIDCPIWGYGQKAEIRGKHGVGAEEKIIIENEITIVSPRAGGGFRLRDESFANGGLQLFHPESKARLTTWLVDKRKRGEQAPVITREIVEHFQSNSNRQNLPVFERAKRLLSFLVDQTMKAGETIEVSDDSYDKSLAWSESTTKEELIFLFEFLEQKDFISFSRAFDSEKGTFFVTVSVEGHEFVRESAINPDSRQAFVAMWFAPEMNDAYEKGIKPAIESAGYNPLRIDKKDDVQKIDDEIFAEIRRSRFLVADMTQGDDGARGGVYFEAGFAQGLGIPVLYTCRKDKMKNLSFDTRQLYHVEWNTPHELYRQLVIRILSVVGEGPLVIEN